MCCDACLAGNGVDSLFRVEEEVVSGHAPAESEDFFSRLGNRNLRTMEGVVRLVIGGARIKRGTE